MTAGLDGHLMSPELIHGKIIQMQIIELVLVVYCQHPVYAIDQVLCQRFPFLYISIWTKELGC